MWRLWRERGGGDPAVVSGHSLGEFTALVCAQVLDFAAAVDLVRLSRPADAGSRTRWHGRDGGDPRPRGRGGGSRPAATPRPGWSKRSTSTRPGQIVIAGESGAPSSAPSRMPRRWRQACAGAAGQRALAQQPDARRRAAIRREARVGRGAPPKIQLRQRGGCRGALRSVDDIRTLLVQASWRAPCGGSTPSARSRRAASHS